VCVERERETHTHTHAHTCTHMHTHAHTHTHARAHTHTCRLKCLHIKLVYLWHFKFAREEGWNQVQPPVFICQITWTTCGWIMLHIWMSHVTHMDEACHTCEWVISHIWMSQLVMSHIGMSHMYVWYIWNIWYICYIWYTQCIRYIWNTGAASRLHQPHHMGWLRLVGSLKLQVSFVEYRLFYRALLQKRPIIWKSQLIVATSYAWVMSYVWISHVTHMDESCHPYECVLYMNESCHTKEWVLSHIWMSHIIHMSGVTHMDEIHVTHVRYKHAHTHTHTH